MQRILEWWKLISALIFAGVGSYFLPSNAIEVVTREIISFYAIQSAAIMPAMIFSAGILNSNGILLSEVESFRNSLKKFMIFCVSLLVLNYLAIASIIIGKSLKWELTINLLATSCTDISGVYLFSFIFFGWQAILRAILFIKGVLSLLDLKVIMIRNEIEIREKDKKAKMKNARNTKISAPDNYGDMISKE